MRVGREGLTPKKNWHQPPEIKFTQLSVADDAICGITEAAEIECWGDGAKAKLIGLANPPKGKFQMVSVGSDAACAIRSNGTPVCWGARSHESLSFSVARAPEAKLTDIEVGAGLACGLERSGKVLCWGEHIDGALIIPDMDDEATEKAAGR